MKCRNCGSESPVGAKYCASCGVVLEDCVYDENQAQTADKSGDGIHDMYANALIKTVKSPVYLVALIFAVIGAVASLIINNGYAEMLLEDNEFTYEFVRSMSTVTCVAISVLEFVFAAGLIMLRIGASRSALSLMRSGLMTIKIVKIVQCVFVCIATAVIIVCLVVVLLVAAAEVALIIMPLVVLMLGAVIALGVVSYIAMFRSLNSAIAITRMQPGVSVRIRRVPEWYGIIVIVMGVIGRINIAWILFGINLMSFSREINRLPYTEK